MPKPPAKKTVPSRKVLNKKPPTKDQREQARVRAEAKRSGQAASAAPVISPFIECFCREYVRVGILEDAHRAAENITRTKLDTIGFRVEYDEWEERVKGKTVRRKAMRIYDDERGGIEVPERQLRQARAAQLYHLPEVQARIQAIRDDYAKFVKVTAEGLSGKLKVIFDHAVSSGQLQVAANVTAMEAKMFGVDAGSGEGGAPPAAAVNINIRDFSGKPAPRED